MTGPFVLDILFACFLAVLICAPCYLYLRWYVPWRDRRWREKVQIKTERIRREEAFGVLPSPSDYHYAIAFDMAGFTVKNLRGPKQEHVVKTWAGVNLVAVFKRDLFTVDCICLHVGSADGTGVELDEEMAGWDQFLDVLPAALPGCKPREEWYPTVVLPPFAPNMTEIYRREDNEKIEPAAEPKAEP